MASRTPQAAHRARAHRAVILTALPVENEAVCAHLSDVVREVHPHGTIYQVGSFAAEGRSWEVSVAEIGPHNATAAQQVERAINHYHPDAVMFVGVAGGLKDVDIGDVVVASKVYMYESGRSEEVFRPRPEVSTATHRMEQLARAEARGDDWIKRIKPRRASRGKRPRVRVGPIAAGAQVVASLQSETIELIRRSYGDALAVEMEGGGFLQAATAGAGVEAVVVRGISDLIEGKAEADRSGSQELAARHAAAFAFELLAKLELPVKSSADRAEPRSEPAIESGTLRRQPPQPAPPSPADRSRSRSTERSDALDIALLYRRRAEPDETLLATIEDALKTHGHRVFVDRDLPIGVDWAQEIDTQVRSADVVIPLLSARSAQSEMLAWELQNAHEEAQRRDGVPRILPVRVNFEEALPPELAAILDRLQYFLWRGPQDDDRLIRELTAALHGPRPILPPRPIPVGGLPLDSQSYVKRSSDLALNAAITRRDSTILIKGARQVGKTSLLARGLKRASDDGFRVAFIDFQRFNKSELETPDVFYRALGAALAEDLDLDTIPARTWQSDLSANYNFERFVKQEVLGRIDAPLFWALDEVDRLFTCAFGSEVFALLRTWHNNRSMRPDGPWRRLTLAISYATEAHLFINDLDQSPFNIGTTIPLLDFSPEQVAELNGRYGNPLPEDRARTRFYELVGGQPYLTNRGLFEMAENGLDLDDFIAQAERSEGIFGDHLRRILVLLAQDPELLDAARSVLAGRSTLTPPCFYRLRAAGIMAGESLRDVRPRCRLYATYLHKHLI